MHSFYDPDSENDESSPSKEGFESDGESSRSGTPVLESSGSSGQDVKSVRSIYRGAMASDDTLVELRRVEEDLRNARNLLETKDAVLEPGLAYTMADFVESGGGAYSTLPFFHGRTFHG